MINFKLSAPGKLILYGEHAVVYGKTALAASLDLRTTLEFEELNSNENHIYISLPKVDLSKKISIKRIEEHFFNNDKVTVDYDAAEFYQDVQKFVEQIGYQNLSQKLAASAFFYLIISIFKSRDVTLKPFRLRMDTMLSVSSGLGSSASFAVCLTTCFIHYANLKKNITTKLDELELETISKYALNCEKIMHGNPSGIDNAVCTYGSIIEFRKNEILRPITGTKSMRVLLVDTKVPRSTKALVEKVANLRQKYPKIFNPILESIDNVSQEALKIIQNMKSEPENSDTSIDNLNHFYTELMLLIEVNQGLLSSCNVSHPALDEVSAKAKEYSLRAKLTGAGGGGYAYILLLPGTQDETITALTNTLVAKGYDVIQTNLGGPGVKIDSDS